jgi:hypothetical protein
MLSSGKIGRKISILAKKQVHDSQSPAKKPDTPQTSKISRRNFFHTQHLN